MLIVTHPDNIDKVLDTFGKYRRADEDHIHHIKPVANMSIRVQGNPMIEKERPTGRYLVEGNRFFTYWDGQGEPPDWALYFGFVKREMEPVYYILGESTVYSPAWDRKK
jgi:hypothetical protein